MSIFKCFLLGLTALTIYFFTLFWVDLWQYTHIQGFAPARVEEWEVVEKGGKYLLKAKYSFAAQGKDRTGIYLFKSPGYLNEFAAVMALKEKAKQPWTAFFHPKDPSISYLETAFPFGLLVKSLVSLSVLIYFVRSKKVGILS